jgi:DNA-binding NarL/FixJ family response regulator
MIRVLVADDHTIVRRGLKEVLSESSEIVVAGEAGNAQEVLDKVRNGHWDAVILDINLPGCQGLDLLAEIRRERKDLPVLILTVYPEDQYAVRALRLGASGYLTKSSAPEQLVEAVRKIARGGRYVSPALADLLAVAVGPGSALAPHESLSEREFQTLRLIASGRTVSQIADSLHLSVKTVSTYRARVLEKMGMSTNAELTHYAVKNHLVD